MLTREVKAMRRRWAGLRVIGVGLILGWFAVIPTHLQAQSIEACVPSAEVKSALDALPADPQGNQTYREFHEQKLAGLRALRERYPNDVFVNREYISFLSNWDTGDELIAEYKVLEEKSGGSPLFMYFYAQTLLGRRTPESIRLYDQALEKDPNFAWPHLALSSIYAGGNFRDPQKQVIHLKAFLAMCPSSLMGYRQLSRQTTDDPELLRESAMHLRALLASRNDAGAVGAYSLLWGLEFRSRPPSEYPQARRQVGEDLKRIRSLDLTSKREWYSALEEGYRLAGDQKSADWAKEQRQERAPSSRELAAREKWTKEHTQPESDDPPEKKKAYYQALLDATNQWLKERPNSIPVLWDRINAARNLQDISPAETESIGEGYLKAVEANERPGEFYDDLIYVAGLYADRGILPNRVIELAQRGLEQLEKSARTPPSDLYDDEKSKASMAFYRESTRATGLALEAKATLNLKDAAKAEPLVAQLEGHLNTLKDLAGDDEGRQRTYAQSEASYWELMARLAETKGRRQDAMAFYENGLLADLRSGRQPNTDDKNDLVAEARRLWDALGGTEQGWQAWYGSKAATAASRSSMSWSKIDKPLPPFQLVDLKGKTWTVAELKGKVTLLNFWSSW